MAIETIPIPSETANAADPFEVTVADLEAWPDQRLRFEFDYNPQMGRWTWSAHHVGEGRIIAPSVATIGVTHAHWPYIQFEFIAGDESRVTAVTPNTLGDRVKLACFPGPLGGQFLQDSGFTREEEQELLSWGTLPNTV